MKDQDTAILLCGPSPENLSLLSLNLFCGVTKENTYSVQQVTFLNGKLEFIC